MGRLHMQTCANNVHPHVIQFSSWLDRREVGVCVVFSTSQNISLTVKDPESLQTEEDEQQSHVQDQII